MMLENLITNAGIPFVCFVLMYQLNKTTIAKNTEAINKLTSAIELKKI